MRLNVVLSKTIVYTVTVVFFLSLNFDSRTNSHLTEICFKMFEYKRREIQKLDIYNTKHVEDKRVNKFEWAALFLVCLLA